jgi:hypothetical protein
MHALNEIQIHCVSVQAPKAYASDRGATATGVDATTYLLHC